MSAPAETLPFWNQVAPTERVGSASYVQPWAVEARRNTPTFHNKISMNRDPSNLALVEELWICKSLTVESTHFDVQVDGILLRISKAFNLGA